MKNISKIYELLDGSLPEAEKVEIFKELANNKDLREEFNYASSLNKTISENKDIFSVPAGSKSAVFSIIGLQLEGVSTSFFSSKLSVGVVSSVVTFILLTSLYFLTNSNEVVYQNQDDTFSKFTSSIQLPVESVNYYNETSEAKSVLNLAIINKEDLKNQDYIFDNNKANKKLEKNFEEYKEFALLSQSEIALNSNINLVKDNYNNSINKLNKVNILESNLTNSNFYIEWNTSVNQNLPGETISPSRIQKFNNNNLALFYKFNKNLDFGLEVRQENFFQKYEDELKFYEQTPNFTTYSLAIKYNLFENIIFQNMSNYIKFQGGGNQGGIVSRFALGLNYEIYDGFGLNANLEYSNLFFKNNFNNYNSEKITLNYGIKYMF